MDGDRSFRLSIDLTEREHSLDSHTNTFEIRVDGTRVHYHGPYGEGTRGMHRTGTTRFRLSGNQRTRIRLELDNYDLRQSVDETFELDRLDDPCSSIDAEATITIDGETHELRIEGITRIRGRETDMEHSEQARGLEALCWTFKGWAEESAAWWNPLRLLPFVVVT